MKYFIVTLSLTFFAISCNSVKHDPKAEQMNAAYMSINLKYKEILKSAESDSVYKAFKEQRIKDWELLLDKYSKENATDQMELIRSKVLIDLYRLDEALVKLEGIIAKNSDSVHLALFQKVRVMQQTKRVDEAVPIFKEIEEKLEKNTKYFDVLLNFAFDASEITEREKYSKKLLSEENWPDEFSDYKSYVYRNLALIEREKGNTEAAKQILKEGIEIFEEKGQAESLKATLNLMGLIGEPAPELFAKKWLNSRAIKVNRLKGKVVVVDFWATWCSPCRVVIPDLVELYEEKKNEGLVILGYTRFYGQYRDDIQNLGKVGPKKELEKVKEFLERFKIKYPVAIAEDKTGFEKYFIRGIPTLVFIDKNGNIADFKIGSGNEEYVKNRAEELLQEGKTKSS
jgi:thiol-disulfide isomerase/thioredoxin/predicted negative regulator of RcsB-dependent stress response